MARGWSITALAAELGMNWRTVAKRVADLAPLEETPKGKLYRLSDVVAVLTAQQAQEKPGDFEEYKTRKMKADAEAAEIGVATLRANIAFIDVMERTLGEELVAVRSRMTGLPDKLAPLCATAGDVDAIRDLIRKEVNEALEELSADSARLLGPAGDAGGEDQGSGQTGEGEVPEPAPDPDIESVGGPGEAAKPGG